MDIHSYSSHSRDSSPPSCDVDSDNPPSSLDEPPSNKNNTNRVKFMCSYGGKIVPKASGNNLSYVGGDTKILTVDRNIKFSAIIAKLSSLCNADVCFRYQLPGEDLDALISVINEEDLENMMVEYDRLCGGSPNPGRLRLILFPPNAFGPTNFGPNELKSGREWFVDALNSLQIPPVEGSLPPAPDSDPDPDPDFMFGSDERCAGVPAAKLSDSAPAPTVLENAAKDFPAGSHEWQVVREPVVPLGDFQRQIHELQKLQLGNNEQLLQQRSDIEGNGRVYNTDYYSQENHEKLAPLPLHAHVHAHSTRVHAPVSVQGSFLPERHRMTSGGYSLGPHVTGTEQQPVYLIQTPSGMYQATTLRPIATPVGQTYYAVPRMATAAEVYYAAPLANSQPTYTEAYSGYYHAAAAAAAAAAPAPAPAPGGVVTTGFDGRQGVGSGALNQECKVVTNVSSATL